MNLCYFSHNFPVTLISLGYIQLHGGQYYSSGTTHTAIHSSSRLPPIDVSPLNSLNLLPVNFRSLSHAAQLNPHLYHHHHSAFIGAVHPNPVSTDISNSTTSSLYSPPSPIKHFTPEQRQRANEVQAAHIALYHPSDASLSSSLSFGKFKTHLTSSDVANNRIIRGPCPECLAGKFRLPSTPS
jgi:hypothetical protein